MNCFHCEEELGPDQDVVPINDGTAFMHRECLLHTVIGSEDHVRRGPHPTGSCQPDDPRLTKREAALAAYRAWLELGRRAANHVDAEGGPEQVPALPFRFLDPESCFGTLGPQLMLDLLAQLTRFPTPELSGQPLELLVYVFYMEFIPLRRRLSWN